MNEYEPPSLSDAELHALEDEIRRDLSLLAAMETSTANKVRRLLAELSRRRNGGTVHEFRPRPGGESR